jgi:hypothetical protein
MQADHPEAWHKLEAAARLLALNKAVLTACRDTAAKSSKEQHCSVVVPAT